MSNIWITGAAGFIGHHLTEYLGNGGAMICGLDYLPQTDGAGANHIADWQAGAIDEDSLDALATRQGRPSIVYHLAGGGSVGASFADPFQDYTSTVAGTATLIEWLRTHAPQAKLIYISSAAVYGDGHDMPIAEDDPKDPYSPYGAHKFAAEQLCISAAKNFAMQIAIVRPFSIYGEGLRKQLLWDCCNRLAVQEEPLVLGGTGKEERDWLHVSDLCRIIHLAGEKLSDEPIIINAGTGVAVSVSEVIGILTAAWRSDTPYSYNFSGESRPGDPFRLVANSNKIAGWSFSPDVAFERGIAAYVAWFKAEKMTKPLRVAFPPVGGNVWIGGQNYLGNLIKAILKYTPDRVAPVLFVDPSYAPDLMTELEAAGAEVIRDSFFFAHRSIKTDGQGDFYRTRPPSHCQLPKTPNRLSF